jgi:hypothetical protein
MTAGWAALGAQLARRVMQHCCRSKEMVDEAQAVKASMAPLFREAREKKLWFYTSYQQIWFSPDELAALNAEGRLLWGAANWRLRDPVEELATLDRKIADAQAERDRFAARIRAA